MKKIYIYLALVSLVLASAAYYYFGYRKSPIKVRTVELLSLQVVKTVSGDVEVKSHNEAELSFKTSGRLESLSINENDNVLSGQTLAKLEPGSVYQSIQASKDLRDIAIRDRELFVEKYKSDESKQALGGTAEYEITLRKYSEEISRTEALYKAQLISLNDIYLKSPISGVAVNVTKSAGENVTVSEKIITIADLSNLYFEATIDQADFANIKLDQPAEIELDAYEDKIIFGKITKMPIAIQKGKDSFILELTSESEDDQNVLYGMTGNAKITTDQTNENTQAVAFDEVFVDDEDKHYVWYADDNNKLRKKYITIGLEGDIYTQILDDVSNLILVVPDDPSLKNIEEGMAVQILKS